MKKIVKTDEIKSTDEKGYIKFECEWVVSNPIKPSKMVDLMSVRDRLHQAGFIGVYENGIGFGNVSIRLNDSLEFIITGLATGQIPRLGCTGYTLVTDYDFEANLLKCKGPIKASSESLTHAAIYETAPEVNAIIHIHNLEFWEKLLGKVPTTSAGVEYGTPAMANEMIRLLKETDTMEKGIIAMAGHKEGIIAFGGDIDIANRVLRRNYYSLKLQAENRPE